MAQDWIGMLLRRLHAPDTVRNLRFLITWNLVEGGDFANSAKFNYVSTNRGDQYPAINKYGIRSFPNLQTGIEMIAQSIEDPTLHNRGILAALHSGNPQLATDPALQASLKNWKDGPLAAHPGVNYYIQALMDDWGKQNPKQNVIAVPTKPPKPPSKKVARPVPDPYATVLKSRKPLSPY